MALEMGGIHLLASVMDINQGQKAKQSLCLTYKTPALAQRSPTLGLDWTLNISHADLSTE